MDVDNKDDIYEKIDVETAVDIKQDRLAIAGDATSIRTKQERGDTSDCCSIQDMSSMKDGGRLAHARSCEGLDKARSDVVNDDEEPAVKDATKTSIVSPSTMKKKWQHLKRKEYGKKDFDNGSKAIWKARSNEEMSSGFGPPPTPTFQCQARLNDSSSSLPGSFPVRSLTENNNDVNDSGERVREETFDATLTRQETSSSAPPELLTAELVDEEDLMQRARKEAHQEFLQSAVSAVVISVGSGEDDEDNKDTQSKIENKQRKCPMWALLLLFFIVVVAIVAGTVAGILLQSQSGPGGGSESVNETTGASLNTTTNNATKSSKKLSFGPWNQVGQTLNVAATVDESMSLSGNGKVLALGKYKTGAVSVFEWDDAIADWHKRGTNAPSTNNSFGSSFLDLGDNESLHFGWAVALSSDGNRMLCGAPGGIENGTGPGFVRVYDYNNNSGLWVPYPDILGSLSGSLLGHSVALSADGQTFVAGGPGYAMNSSYFDMGYAQAYRFNSDSGEWLQLGQDLFGMSVGDRFGEALAMSDNGSVLVSSGHLNSNDNGNRSGIVQVFEYLEESGTWEQRGQSLLGDEADDGFGWDVALSGNGAVVASVGKVFWTDQPGYVRVFQYDKDGSGNWTQLGQDLISESMGELYGYNVALSHDGKTLVCSHPYAIVNEFSDIGLIKVFTYETNSDQWVQLGPNIDGLMETNGAYGFGHAIGMSSDGSVVAAGSWPWNADPGYTQVFKLNQTFH